MLVHVRLFAALREGFGDAHVAVELCESPTAADVKLAVSALNPALSDLIRASRVAVNHTFVPDASDIELASREVESLEIALIPPVSGG